MKSPIASCVAPPARPPARWRQLGVLTLLAFTVKGVVSSSMIVWALLQAWP